MAIDPVLSQRILSAGRRFTPPGLDRLPPLDLLLISANQYEHLDAWWESVHPGGLEVTFLPAHHWSRRGVFDQCVTLWGGWVLTVPGGLRVYQAGDSAYGPFFGEIGSRYPGIDAAMLPIGAYAPRWFIRYMHSDPEEALLAFQDHGARVMVPMHWGAFRLSREPALEPIERTRAAWVDADRDHGKLWDLSVGEGRPLQATAPGKAAR